MALISDCIRELEADAFWLRVNHALDVTRSHYEDSIKMDQVCIEYADIWGDSELEDLGAWDEPFTQRLADSHVDFVFPKKK